MFGTSVYQFGIDSNTLPVLPNLVAWFDPSDANTVTSAGMPLTVSQLNDKSGNTHNAVQGNASFQPEFVPDTVNGLPILRFDGSDDFLTLGSVVISGTVARTFFFVVRADMVPGNNDAILSLTTENTAGERYDITSQPSLRVTGGNRIWTNSILSATDYFVMTIQNQATADVNVTLGRLNGIVMTQASAASESITTGTGGTTRLGERNIGSDYFNGDLGEVVMYDRALSASEIDSVENYLGVKWGIIV